MCGESFNSEWSDDDESWMYRNCIRLSDDFLSEPLAELEKLHAAAPAHPLVEDGSAQSTAAAAKEADRQTQLYRVGRIVAHVRAHMGHILHQACHYGLIQSIMKSKPAQSPMPAGLQSDATASAAALVKADEP